MAAPFAPETTSTEWTLSRNAKIWMIVLFLTLLLHLLILSLPRRYFFAFNPFQKMKPIALNTVNPETLEQIRSQWKQRMLINKNQQLSKTTPTPKDARYFSDRNIRVEKEQRAADRLSKNLPEKNTGNPDAAPMQPQAIPMPDQVFPPADLKKLGVPLLQGRQKSPPRPKTSSPSQNQMASNSAPYGGHQWIDEKDLPQGAETMLNAAESVYYSYFLRVAEAIEPPWRSTVTSTSLNRYVPEGEYVTVVDLVFDDGGNYLYTQYLKESGIQEYDTIIEQVMRKLQRLPNPPRELLDSTNRVHFPVKFTVQRNQQAPITVGPPRLIR